jgi:2-(1,2-epoxy-1,2-dihydrophenyl)acetyl-CoA isomerase
VPFSTITFETADDVAVLTLNRPDRLNALSQTMLRDMTRALEIADDPQAPARCLLITGAGEGFCAGANLAGEAPVLPHDPQNITAVLDRFYHPFFKRLRDLRMPVVCAVNGPAAGAGASLALNSDIVFAARSAYFLQAFVNVGLIPDAGGTYFLPRLVGRARALSMIMLGERIEAQKAADWGLIHACVDDAALMDTALACARQLAKGPTKALTAMRRAINASASNTLDDQLELELALQSDLTRSGDFTEGVSAFMQKRSPEFKGR